jgi:CubicO group peptidase (beta-lactamase class C family)
MLAPTKPKPIDNHPVRPRVAAALAAGLLIVTAFQAALTFGAPLGAAAQGGTNPGQLPDALRLVTGLSAVLSLFATLLVLARGGYALVPLSRRITQLGAWVLVGLLGLGTLMNVASSSPWERFGWGPFTLVLLVLGVVLARSGLPPEPRGGSTMDVRSPGPGSSALKPKLTTDTSHTTSPGLRRRLVLLAVVAGLALGGLVGLVVGPHSLHLGPRFSGDQQLAADFRATLDGDRGFASVEVARLRDGKVTYAGLAPEGTDAPTPQTPFELGSITKTMTGMLLADAVRRGEMRRDAPVSDYLPELVGTAAGAATLDQLATHHSGLPALPSGLPSAFVLALLGNANPYAMSVETLLQLARDTPVGTPGRYAYSNLGMSLLGHAEARAAGAVDWPALARQRLLVPLGMTNTTFVTSADQIPPVSATPHHDNGWRAPHWHGTAFIPAGTSTITTAEDVMKYARAMVERNAPGLAALEPVADADVVRIGLAWVTSEVSGRMITWHDGATGGYRSLLALDRQTGQAVLVLNSSTRSVDDPGLQLAAAASAAELEAIKGPGPGLGLIAAVLVGLVLLVSGAAAVLRARHRIAAVRGAVNAVAGLVMLRVHGPWTLVPGELWSALAGLVLASVVVGSLRFRAQPVGPDRRRWASVASLGFAVLVLLALVWTA